MISNHPKYSFLVDQYIEKFPQEVQTKLQELRRIIHENAQEAYEKISYQMPTLFLHHNLVHFAAFPHHIGFYPGSSGIEHFKEELKRYHFGKGSIQFPLNEPLPHELIKSIVKYRVDEENNHYNK
ncbi:MAG: iron chaperone [Bacilli bacterium]